MKVRAHVQVSGRVTGVFFRVNTQELAQRLGVKGWVKNMGNGVEAIFEGERDKVEDMIKFCRTGPLGARVSRVDVNWEDYRGEFSDFDIIYGWR